MFDFLRYFPQSVQTCHAISHSYILCYCRVLLQPFCGCWLCHCGFLFCLLLFAVLFFGFFVIFLNFNLFSVYECFACIYVHLLHAWCLWSPEEGFRSPELELRFVVVLRHCAGASSCNLSSPSCLTSWASGVGLCCTCIRWSWSPIVPCFLPFGSNLHFLL